MRVATRFATTALWVTCLAALPLFANDFPQAHLQGYSCKSVRDSEAPAGTPSPTILVCQIEDGVNPFIRSRSSSGTSAVASPTLDSLRNLFTILHNARHEASRQRRNVVVPRPTP